VSGGSRLLDALAAPGRTVGVELRPPRSGLSRGGAIDIWIDLSHSVGLLAARGAHLLLTDSAVGEEEEENLQHLATNLTGEIAPGRVVPFLTCKHPLDYCLVYAERARARGLEALTVVGGDPTGPPRCVPHAYLLRNELRARVPDLGLGGWVNPHGDPDRQAGFVADDGFDADYYFTQVVSHHDLDAVEAWLGAAARAGIDLPGSFGVFYYRNGRPEALARLAAYFPVPADGVGREFAEGVTPADHCARSIVALRRLGVENVYICNLGSRLAGRRYAEVLAAVDRLETA
jgi:hypothetical protein